MHDVRQQRLFPNKVSLALYFFISLTINSFSQCSIEDVFLVDIGTSRLGALKNMQLKDNYILQEQKYSGNYWYKPDYLQGDSVYRTRLLYQIINHDCFNCNKVDISFNFADDKLYNIMFSAEYEVDKFKHCYDDYKRIADLLNPLYENH